MSMTTPTAPKWISLPPTGLAAASTDDLEAALARRREEEQRAAEAAAKEAAIKAHDRARRLRELPGILSTWRKRIKTLAGMDTGRPSGLLRGRARALLLPAEQSAAEWVAVLEADPVAAELQHIAHEAGLLLVELSDADEKTLAAVDAVECAAFAAVYARVRFLAFGASA